MTAALNERVTKLTNGAVYTLDPSRPIASGITLVGEQIAALHHDTSPPLRRPSSSHAGVEIDLEGRCVLPGFTDSHAHFGTWAVARESINLVGVRRADEVIKALRSPSAALSKNWIIGFGWREADWADEPRPHRRVIDGVTGQVPTALIARDYHSVWVNTAALKTIPDEFYRKHGGVVEVDSDGFPTGILREQAAWRFRDECIRLSEDDWIRAMKAGVQVASRRGVTAIHDKDGWLGAARLWQRIQSEGQPSLRVWQSLPIEQLPSIKAIGVRNGLGHAFLKLGYLKAFADGALGSETALMTDGRGQRLMEQEELEYLVREASVLGWPVAVHAVGNLANHEVLDVFEATQDAWRPRGIRHRVEHAQCVDPEDLPRFASLGISCSVQFSHAPVDRDIADRLWAGATSSAYAYRSLLDTGALLSNGSDAPTAELHPLQGIQAAATRTLDVRPSWHPEQCLTVEEAFVASTVIPAWLAYEEESRGRLSVGQQADLVILDRDPFKCALDDIGSINVSATMVAGRWVYGDPL